MRKKRKHDQVVRNLELILSISFHIARHAKHDSQVPQCSCGCYCLLLRVSKEKIFLKLP